MSDEDGAPPPAGPPSRSRRRLLLGLGLGGAAAGLARAVEPLPPGGASTRPRQLTSTGPPAVVDAPSEPRSDHRYGLVLAGGRVIDPETGFDQLADVGIDGATIAGVGQGLVGDTIVDVSGLVVAPGFIDLLSAEPDPFGIWFKVADGVTTNLALHGVNNYANAFFSSYEGQSPAHFGGAWHQHFIRSVDSDVGAVQPDESLDETQIEAFARLTDFNLGNGLAGICFSPEYSPGTTMAEMERLGQVAAARGHGLLFHARYSDPDEPGTSFEAIAEVLEVARRTGTWVHIEHLTSTGATFVLPQTLEILENARSEGIDVTADVYPYDFWGTTLGSHRFSGDWQGRYRISYEDLQVAGTSRRLTAADFDEAMAENLLVAALGSIPEEEVRQALAVPWIMVASDGILTRSLNHHPRGAGTFSRTLGQYSREFGVVGLVEALGKMTILPAKRLEGMLPDLARKGRLQRGADADIVVFDPLTIIDRATVETPSATSQGIAHVFVDGQVVLRDGVVDRTVFPGRALKSA